MAPFELPTFEATWWPVQMETVPGSGERLTIAVVVRARNGQATVRQAIDPPLLTKMFGDEGKGMQFVVGTTVIKLQQQLNQMIPVEELRQPFGGIELGAAHDGLARDLQEFAGMALRMSSGFAMSSFGARTEEDDLQRDVKQAFDEWSEKIRLQVLSAQAAEEWSAAFNMSVPLSPRKKARFGFAHGSYVAQFGLLRPGRSVSADLRALKVKLFDLEAVRRERAIQFSRADLVIGYQDPADTVPARQRDTLLGSLEHVDYEARARGVRLVRYVTAQEAAMHVLQEAIAA